VARGEFARLREAKVQRKRTPAERCPPPPQRGEPVDAQASQRGDDDQIDHPEDGDLDVFRQQQCPKGGDDIQHDD